MEKHFGGRRKGDNGREKEADMKNRNKRKDHMDVK